MSGTRAISTTSRRELSSSFLFPASFYGTERSGDNTEWNVITWVVREVRRALEYDANPSFISRDGRTERENLRVPRAGFEPGSSRSHITSTIAREKILFPYYKYY